LVRPESRRKCRFTAAALMVTAADSVLSSAERKGLGVFIGQERRKIVSPEIHDPLWRRHGAEAVGDVLRADGQWRKAACAGASAWQPLGTGLGVGNESRPVGTQCSRSPASDRWSQARSGVHARWYGSEADMACPDATSCAGARVCKDRLTYPFCTRIFSSFQNRSSPNFEY
jgi:hypothetical protein